MDETQLGQTLGADASSSIKGEVVSSRLARGASLGRYVVLGQVGEGGMGVVYAAYDPELDRKVAIKLLHPSVASSTQSQGSLRLVREAQSLARLQHPEVLAVHDVGVHDGRVFVAMEYVEGDSLRTWIDGGPRPWRDVLAVFLAAGRGLLAAHDKGLVHRDFKPDNVMLDVDPRTHAVTRVRVMDFGLARESGAAETEAAPAAHGSASRIGAEELTRTGAIVGTPAYIAPEQYRGEPAHAKSDQFAYCVALYEGLYGERPFAGRSHSELVASIGAGAIRSPGKSPVPGWLRDVVVRGLAAEPAERWPSMIELLAALQRDPTGRRRRRWALGGLALSAIAVVGIAKLLEYRRVNGCEALSHAIDDVWSDEARARVEAGLLGTGAGYAPRTWTSVSARVDEQVEAWREQRFAACVDPSGLSPPLVAAQDDCFAGQLDALADRLELLATADMAILNRAIGLVTPHRTRDSCIERDELERLVALSPSTTQREEIAGLQRRLTHAAILQTAGRYDEAVQIAAEVAAQADGLAATQLVAAAHHRRGRVLSDMSRYPAAERELEDAFFGALEGRDDWIAADAAVLLCAVTGANLARHDDGVRWGRQASVLLELRGDHDEEFTVALEHSLGLVAFAAGDYPVAIEHLERALALRTRSGDDHSPTVIRVLKSLGAAYERQHQPQAAIEHVERALRLSEEVLGPDHPLTADAHNDVAVAFLGSQQFERGQEHLERAVQIYEAAGLEEKVATTYDNLSIAVSSRSVRQALDYNAKALEIRERTLPADHPAIADSLVNRGTLLHREGSSVEAVALLRRAIPIYEATLGPESEKISDATFNLANTLRDTGAFAEAVQLARRTLELRRKGLRAGHPKTDQALLLLGMNASAAGELASLVPDLERALAERSEPPRAPRVQTQLALSLAEALLAAGEPAKALAQVDAAELDVLPPSDLAQALFLRGRALWNSGGDRVEARQLATTGLDMLRDDPARRRVVGEIEAWLAAHR